MEAFLFNTANIQSHVSDFCQLVSHNLKGTKVLNLWLVKRWSKDLNTCYDRMSNNFVSFLNVVLGMGKL